MPIAARTICSLALAVLKDWRQRADLPLGRNVQGWRPEVQFRHIGAKSEPARPQLGLVIKVTRDTIQQIFEGGDWRIGFIGAGERRGSAVLVWPLGPAHVDVVFDVPVDFLGSRSDDPFAVSAGDTAAVEALDKLEIEWVEPGPQSLLAVRQHFPGSRAARGETP